MAAQTDPDSDEGVTALKASTASDARGTLPQAEKPAPELVAALAAGILERTHALQDLAAAVAQEDYVSTEPVDLAVVIGRLAKALRPEIVAFYERYVQTGLTRYVERLRGIDIKVRKLTGDLRLAERATATRVPGVLTRLVATKVDALSPGARILLRPVWNYHYKIVSQDIYQRYRQDLKTCFATSPTAKLADALGRPGTSRLFVVSFPIVERRSIHLHSVLGHEIGHLIAREHDPTPEQTAKFKREFDERYRSLHQKEDPRQKALPMGGADLLPEYVRASEAREQARREYTADAASVCLLGIPAVLGAAEIAMSTGLQHNAFISRSHPAWSRRLLNMMEFAKRNGWLDLALLAGHKTAGTATAAVRNRLEQIEAWAKADPGTPPMPPGLDWEELGQAAAFSEIESIRQFVTAICQRIAADASRTYVRLPTLLKRMVDGLPPDSFSPDELEPEPAELQDVLVAAWWYRVSIGEPKFDPASGLTEACLGAADVLRNLTLKAIENVDFVSTYKERVRAARARGEP